MGKNDDRMIDLYLNKLTEYKQKYGDKTILLWQCGSFWESYGFKNVETGEYYDSNYADFIYTTRITEAKKNVKKIINGIEYQIIMGGIPHTDYHLEKYINILTNDGYTIAVWVEEEMKTSGPKNRYESQIFSPGCYFSNEKKIDDTNNIACYVINKSSGLLTKNPSIYFGCSVIDIFTGKVKLYEYNVSRQNIFDSVTFDELEKFNSIYMPTEIIVIHNLEEKDINNIINFCNIRPKTLRIINQNNDDEMSLKATHSDSPVYQKEIITKYYKNITDYQIFLKTTTLDNCCFALKSLCFLMNFMSELCSDLTYKLQQPIFDNIKNKLLLANHSIRQLNIISNNNNNQYSSVHNLVNKCSTPMGRRNLKDKLLHPTNDEKYLNDEYKIIEHFKDNWDKYSYLRSELKKIKDIEYFYRKIIFKKIIPNELSEFYKNLKIIEEIHNILKQDEIINKYLNKNIKINIINVSKKLMNLLETNIDLKICESIADKNFERNFFNDGVSTLLDKKNDKFLQIEKKKDKLLNYLNDFVRSGSKKKQPITKTVKMHIPNKTQCYFYCTNSRFKHLKNYLDKNEEWKNNNICKNLDTITCSKGGINGSVKLGGSYLNKVYNDFETNLDNLRQILSGVFNNFLIDLTEYNDEISDFVKYVSNIDTIITKCYIAIKYNYCKPVIESKAKKAFVDAKDLRHPLVERIQEDEIYEPNDICIGKEKNGILIYGTNGVGKSCITKSLGISVIMAQAGMFVPCTSFNYKPYTSIYTRILGNDNIFKGLSTFNVEMSEVCTFLNNADKNSLILGDEVCSGTETSSAVCIFASVLMWLNKKKSSFIFATHFHELINFKEIQKMQNATLSIKHLSVVNKAGTLYYIRKLEEGSGENAYGLEVCSSFEFPEQFIKNANKMRNKYFKNLNGILDKKSSKYNKHKLKGKCEFCESDGVDIHHLEPQEESNINNYIRTFHKNHKANLTNICKKCHLVFTKNKTIHKKVKTNKGYILVEQ